MKKLKMFQLLSRVWNGPQNALTGKQAEEKMTSILRNKFPKAKVIEVSDVSGKNNYIFFYNQPWVLSIHSVINCFNFIEGGCGAMFEVHVVAPEFQGMNTVKQHRAINEVNW